MVYSVFLCLENEWISSLPKDAGSAFPGSPSRRCLHCRGIDLWTLGRARSSVVASRWSTQELSFRTLAARAQVHTADVETKLTLMVSLSEENIPLYGS